MDFFSLRDKIESGLSIDEKVKKAFFDILYQKQCSLYFYQKKDSYVRLQIIMEDSLWENYVPWEQWVFFCRKLDEINLNMPAESPPSEEGFSLFCEIFHIPLIFPSRQRFLIFTHGDIPLWFFPAWRPDTLWEFFLPIPKHKSLRAQKEHLIIYDDTLSHEKTEQEMLTSLWHNPDSVHLDFLSSVVWTDVYETIHVIAHGKNSALLSKNKPLRILPVLASRVVFFHCCEILKSSHSIGGNLLSQGAESIIAPVTTIPDNEASLESIRLFYQLAPIIGSRPAFHLTSLSSPVFKNTFRIALPYQRLYGA